MGRLKTYNDDRDLIPFFAWYSGFSPDMCSRLWRNTFQSDLKFPRDIPAEDLARIPEDYVDEALWWDVAVENFLHWVKAYRSRITNVIPLDKGDYPLAMSDMAIATVLHGKEPSHILQDKLEFLDRQEIVHAQIAEQWAQWYPDDKKGPHRHPERGINQIDTKYD